jgi:transcriptional regulator with XRE-family HTH domain
MVIHTTSDLGRLIRERRETVGLTATQAAKLAGVSRRLLIELERGKRRNVGILAVLRILELLGLRMEVKPRGLPGTESLGSGGPLV